MVKKLQSLLGVCLVFLSISLGYSQKPFDCNGKMYRVVERNGGSALEKINLSPAEEVVIDFEELQFFAQKQLNGICYNPVDNLIYGLELGENYRLFRIDANFDLSILKTLDLPRAFFFVAGDISPDGRYLVLLGFSQKEKYNILVKVDLQAPDYPLTIQQLVTTGSEAIYCADIAFHPTTQQLFGFDHKAGRLVTIDPQKGIIDNTFYPILDDLSGNMPSLFFDPYGRLYGIAIPSPRQESRRLYTFNIESGASRELAYLGPESNQDACSCPFTVNLYQRVSLRKAFPCTALTFTIRLVNRSPFLQANLRLRDTLARDLIIEEILYNPFEGRILSGPGTNVLAIDGFDLPIGTDSIVFRVSVPEGSQEGQYASQARLYNIQLEAGGEPQIRLSDDPQTAVEGDPTRYEIAPLEILFAEDFPVLCAGETVALSPQVEGAVDYHWSTGDTEPTLMLSQAGWYEVSVSTACGTASGGIYVEQDQLELQLSTSQIEVERGSTVELAARIQHSYTPASLLWQSRGTAPLPDCLTCEVISVPVPEDAIYQVSAVNTNGCSDQAEVNIRTGGFAFYAPTAFSPDGNGHNDLFHLFGKFDFDILQFSVYDRWGALIFHRENGRVNDPAFSWDGQSNGEPVSTGVYLWAAQIRSGSGQLKNLSGEVHLIR
jgi:gliding motility-associated-like protein